MEQKLTLEDLEPGDLVAVVVNDSTGNVTPPATSPSGATVTMRQRLLQWYVVLRTAMPGENSAASLTDGFIAQGVYGTGSAPIVTDMTGNPPSGTGALQQAAVLSAGQVVSVYRAHRALRSSLASVVPQYQ